MTARTGQRILFIDRKRARGGGQVVLENLLQRPSIGGIASVLVSKPLADLLRAPRGSAIVDPRAAVQSIADDLAPTIVVNATSDFSFGLNLARRLRREGRSPRLVGILHNYPRDRARMALTRFALRRYDDVVVVEPGLLSVAPHAYAPPWLSIVSSDRADTPDGDPPGRTVKAFARPDRSKGLDFLPAIFAALDAAGIRCEVALGEPLERNPRYVSAVRAALQPWLVDGRRGPDWLVPGDVFLLTSRSGEAACLSAQEAMARSAAVVAPRIGLMPYLAPNGGAMTTYPIGDTSAAARAVQSVLADNDEELLRGCEENAATVSDRADRWYWAVDRLLTGTCELLDARRCEDREGAR